MRSSERDELLWRQTRAAERQADALAVSAAQSRAERDESLRAAFPPLRRLFGGERGAIALLRSIPGFAELWERSVPERFLLDVLDREGSRWLVVLCPCGEQVALTAGQLADCPGACGRYFLSTGAGVRTHRFDPGDVLAAREP